MPGEGVEVAAELADVGGKMGNSLGSVDEKQSAVSVADACDLGDGVDDPEHVRHLGDGAESGASAEQGRKFGNADFSPVIYG